MVRDAMLPIPLADTALRRGPVSDAGHERRDGAAHGPGRNDAFLTALDRLVAAVTPVAGTGAAGAERVAHGPGAPDAEAGLPATLRDAMVDDAGQEDVSQDPGPIPDDTAHAVPAASLVPPLLAPTPPAQPQGAEAGTSGGRGRADPPAADRAASSNAEVSGFARPEIGVTAATTAIPPVASVAEADARTDAAPANGRPADRIERGPVRPTGAVQIGTVAPGMTIRPNDAATPASPLYDGLPASPAPGRAEASARDLPAVPPASVPPQSAAPTVASAGVVVRMGRENLAAPASEPTRPTEVPVTGADSDARPTGSRPADPGTTQPPGGPSQSGPSPSGMPPGLTSAGVDRADHRAADTLPSEIAGISRGPVEPEEAGEGQALRARPSAQGDSPAASASATAPKSRPRVTDDLGPDVADGDQQAMTVEPAGGPGAAISHRPETVPHNGASNLPPAFGHRLAEIVARFPDRPVEVTLSPEELGRVRMTLATQDGTLTLAVHADRSETVELMRRHIDQLAQEFRDLGFADLNFSFSHRDGAASDSRPEPRAVSALEEAAPPLLPATSLAPGHAARDGTGGGLDLRM